MHWYWISAHYLCVSGSERKKMLSVLLSDISQDKYFSPHFGPFFLHMRFLFQAVTTFFRTPVHVDPSGLGKQ